MVYKDFVDLLYESEIIDTRYPLRSTYVWFPYGLELKEKIFQMVYETFSNNGYERYQFPRLIPGQVMKPITQNIQDFEKGLFWLYTKGDADKTELHDIFLNPTSEAVTNWMLRLWLHDGKELPIKMYQVGSTYRPHERPHALVNADECFNLVEAHSVHSSRDEALVEMEKILKFMEGVHDRLGIPYKLLKRPVWGNKAVAETMYSFETFLPFLDRSFNVGVAYNQGQIFSRAFGTKFTTKEGRKDFTYQNTFGLSERCVAAALALHSDDYGLRLLPEFSPIQVAVIPFKQDRKILEYNDKVIRHLDGLRIRIDQEYKRPFLERLKRYMKMGVPVRVGLRTIDAENDTVKFSRRDILEVKDLPLESLRPEIERSFTKIYENLYRSAKTTLESHIVTAHTIDQLSSITTSFKIGRFAWCEDEQCGKQLEYKLEGEILGTASNESSEGLCINCGGKTATVAYFAKRAYSP